MTAELQEVLSRTVRVQMCADLCSTFCNDFGTPLCSQPYPDFPIKGVLFQDVFPIFQDPRKVDAFVKAFAKFSAAKFGRVDVIIGLVPRQSSCISRQHMYNY